MTPENRLVLGKLVRYIGTGGLAAVVDLGGFVMLVRSGWQVALAATASFLVAMVFNYLASSKLAFCQELSCRRFGLFCIAALAGLAVNVGVTSLGIMVFAISPALAKALGIAVAFALNFTLNLRVTFREDRASP